MRSSHVYLGSRHWCALYVNLLHLVGRHLLPVRLHDEPEPVAGDGADAEGRHEDGELLTGLDELAQVQGVAAWEKKEQFTR